MNSRFRKIISDAVQSGRNVRDVIWINDAKKHIARTENIMQGLFDRAIKAEEELARRDAAAPVAYITNDRRHLIFADSPNMLPADKTGLTALVEKPASHD